MKESLETLGKLGESAFNNWLKRNGLSFLYVNQDRETFSPLFRSNLKRPDFLVLLESIGLIAVDVKNYTPRKDYSFTLNLEKEVRRVITFERVFRIPVWYVYLSKETDTECWYWISALKALEVGEMDLGEIREKKLTGERFIVLKLEHFEKVVTGEDLGCLYTHRMPGFRAIKNIVT